MVAAYEQWVESLGLPIHKNRHYIDDLTKVEMGWWEERGCNAAFIPIIGMEGIVETKVINIPAGKTTRPWKFALDDVYYVLEGKGLTTVWQDESGTRKTFEWQERSLFMIPRQSFRQLTNAQGSQPATLLSYNYLPFAMQVVEDLDFYFNNPYLPRQGVGLEDFYSEAKAQEEEEGGAGVNTWYGNFFPDMGVWDKLKSYERRGGGGSRVGILFPNSTHRGHMSVFPVGRYKKAHRHGPGRAIVIPAGDGFSILWEEGKEKIVCPWHEASIFTPPDQWYHQHFNVGSIPARYLALAPPHLMSGHLEEHDEDVEQNEIQYPDEDPWIKEFFEKELAKRGVTSLMPKEAYKDRNYRWKYAGNK